MIQTTYMETIIEKSLQNPDNPTNNNFTHSDDNVTNNPGKIGIIPNELIQYIYTNCHYSESQSAVHEDMQLHNTSFNLDQITIFSIGLPELMTIVYMVGKYYRWFNVSSKPLKDSLDLELIYEGLKNLLGLMQ